MSVEWFIWEQERKIKDDVEERDKFMIILGSAFLF